mgnify:CR=1 FL=1
MPGSLLALSSLGISAGLYIYGVENAIIPDGLRFIILLALMVSGIVISYFGVRSGQGITEQDATDIASKALEMAGLEE